MKRLFRTNQILVFATATLAFLALASGFFWQTRGSVSPGSLEIANCPFLGRKDAPIQMVLFEDLLCRGCREFNLEILPRIQSKYIEPGIVQFTVVPLAFLPGSKPVGNAVLAVYHIAPERTAAYMHAVSEGIAVSGSEAMLQQKLINLAKAIGGIDLLEFKTCVMTDCHYDILEQNFSLAQKVMGKEFGTPTLYINGAPVKVSSFKSVEIKVEQLLNQ